MDKSYFFLLINFYALPTEMIPCLQIHGMPLFRREFYKIAHANLKALDNEDFLS
jgi:hypothetical protein